MSDDVSTESKRTADDGEIGDGAEERRGERDAPGVRQVGLEERRVPNPVSRTG